MADSPVGRLAFRVENDMWNAYYALPNTMADAILLGSIRMKFVQSEDRKQAFMALVQDCFADMIEDITGHRATFPDGPVPAPNSEGSHGGI